MTLKTIGYFTMLTVCILIFPPAIRAIDKPPHVEVDGNIKWVYDYDEGQLLSQASGKPMFVVFRCER
jgi:hypothetical protein